MSTSAGDIIKQALKAAGALGVGQVPLAEDSNDALYQLNLMMAEWRMGKNQYFVYHQITKSITSTGATSYSIGPGGDINVPHRPNKIQSAFVRQISVPQPNTPDYPLGIIESQDDYNRIIVKKTTSFPSFLFYDSGFPLGTLYPWPNMLPAIYALHVSILDVLESFTDLTSPIDLPDGYESAIFYNLAKRLAPLYKLPMDPRVDMQAASLLRNLRATNARIAQLQMPRALTRPGIYDPYSDRVR